MADVRFVDAGEQGSRLTYRSAVLWLLHLWTFWSRGIVLQLCRTLGLIILTGGFMEPRMVGKVLDSFIDIVGLDARLAKVAFE